MKNIIVGKRSILSKALKKKIFNSAIISGDDFLKLKLESKTNLIINLAYPSHKISTLQKYNDFIYESLSKLAMGLDRLDKNYINKIIYTSSSSIYGLKSNIEKSNDGNRKIYSASKVLSENIIISFCKKNNLSYTITRIFNLYGEKDKFSIIAKLIEANSKKKEFTLMNKGSSIRDFISYDEVSNIYKKILKSKKSEIIDVGTGYGTQIKDIIKSLKRKNIKIKNKKSDEIPFSVSKLNDYNIKSNPNNFLNFIKKKFQLKTKPHLDQYKLKNNYPLKKNLKGTIIYGAGNAGKQLYKILNKHNQNSVFCFVDDNKKIQNKNFESKKIISFEKLKELSLTNTLTNIIISIPSINPDKLKKKIEELKKISLNVNYIPLKNSIMNDKITLDDINFSSLSDILERKVYQVNKKLLSKFSNKIILVTGGTGSIGKAICSKLNELGVSKIIALDKSEIGIYNMKKEYSYKNVKFVLGDINRKNILENIKKKYKIDIVFHAAAYKHLNILENNVCEAVRNNIFGTLNIIEVFKNSKLIIISTDKATKPTSVLGLTKRISEIISLNFKNKKTKIAVVRFGNVFASQGSAINLFINQISSGGPVTLTNKNVERYFMSSGEAANLVLQGSQLSQNRKILVLDMGKQIKIIRIIKKLIEIQKIKNPFSNIKIKYIGLRKNEKMKEKLFINKTKKINTHKNIFIANEPNYSISSTQKLIMDLNHCLENYKEKKIISVMKNFLNKEI